MSSLSLFKKLSFANIKSAMQYPTNFIFSALGQFIANIVELIALFFFFERFGTLDGWALGETCLLYGTVNTSFGVIEMICRGIDTLGHYVRKGTLDILLVRPRPIFVLILGLDFKLANIGRIANGLIPLLYGIYLTNINSPKQFALIAYALVLSGAVFFALLVTQATFTILGQTNIEFMNIFTYGGIQLLQFPLSIYSKFIIRIFTYAVPLGLGTFYPVASALGKNIAHLNRYLLMSPILTSLFIVISFKFFSYGLKHYQSTGS